MHQMSGFALGVKAVYESAQQRRTGMLIMHVLAEQGCSRSRQASKWSWAVVGSPQHPGPAHGRPEGSQQSLWEGAAAHHCGQHRLRYNFINSDNMLSSCKS